MSWQKQMEDIVSGWTETQQRMWDNWMEALRTLGYSDQADAWQRQYQQSLEAWEQAVQEALARQQAWARAWSGTPEDASPGGAANQWAGQMQEMMTLWTESQRRLWGAWLDQSRTAGAGEGESSGLEAVAAAWEDAVGRSQQAMAEWSEMTAAGDQVGRDARGGAGTGKSAPGGAGSRGGAGGSGRRPRSGTGGAGAKKDAGTKKNAGAKKKG